MSLAEWKGRSDGLVAHAFFKGSPNFALSVFAFAVEGWLFYSAVNSVTPQIVLNLGFDTSAWRISVRQLSYSVTSLVASIPVTWVIYRHATYSITDRHISQAVCNEIQGHQISIGRLLCHFSCCVSLIESCPSMHAYTDRYWRPVRSAIVRYPPTTTMLRSGIISSLASDNLVPSPSSLPPFNLRRHMHIFPQLLALHSPPAPSEALLAPQFLTRSSMASLLRLTFLRYQRRRSKPDFPQHLFPHCSKLWGQGPD